MFAASGSDVTLFVGAGMISGALAIVTYLLVARDTTKRRVPRRSLRSDAEDVRNEPTGGKFLESIRGAATDLGARIVEASERQGRIDAALDRAGLVMRAGEFVAAVAGSSLLVGLILFLVMGPMGGLFGVVLTVVAAPLLLKFLTRRRNAGFANQLGDALLMMAGSLRSGLGLGSAIDSVANEFPPPISIEFQRAILETRLGRTLEDALAGVASRVDNEDFEWVVDAIRINRQVGGDLGNILDRVSQTIRDRARLRRQVASLTAEGRMSAFVLGGLPLVVGGVLYVTNPDYVEPLVSRTAGNLMLGASGTLLVAGVLWLKKLISVEM